ncbi:alkaline phosphatase family protein [Lacisediminihabitans sp. H27-G8]|uniref:alkaline phosphatase family protein n=1 Tax=Lacisediminihabitans sp. H27-G8 TaxID=3111909 RepID=UPI0038FCF528
MPSSLQAITHEANRLTLPPVEKAIVLLVDGLGASALTARHGHARTLAPLLTAGSIIGARFPSTTASALATLTTGEAAGVHGLVGYSVLDAANDRVVNQLSGWDARLDPATWQRVPTLFEKARDAGIPSFAIGTERYRSSGFTRAVLRGAEYRSGATMSDRFEEARRTLDEIDRGLIYLYVPELDQAGHAWGWQSAQWTTALEELDSEVRAFAPTLRAGEGMLLTADHGVLDVPASSQVLFDSESRLIDGVRFVAGEPRALQLHFEPDASEALRASVLAAWREIEGPRSWIVSRSEAIDSGWFGAAVDAEVAPRIGDIIVAARKGIAYYDSRVTGNTGRNMVGQHGSWSADELSVPLLRFGAFAR